MFWYNNTGATNMQDTTLNLCDEIVQTLGNYEFTTEEISKVTSNTLFIDAIDKNSEQQRALLSLMLYRFMVYSGKHVDVSIKMALSDATSSLTWLDSIRLNILPYIKRNNILSINFEA